jgi:hypothetical protein
MLVGVLLAIAAFTITWLFLMEALRYRAGVHLITPRRFRLRLAAWLLAMLLCACMFVQFELISPRYAIAHPALVLALWTVCLVSAVALIGIMLADIREVENRVRQRESEIWRDFAHMLAAHGDQAKAPEKPEKRDEPPA